MKILIFGINYAPEKVGVAIYTTGLAEALSRAGHQVKVVTGRPYYPGWKVMAGHNGWTFGNAIENSVSVTRVPHYIPAKPTGGRRVLHHLSFALAGLGPAIASAVTMRPDVVVAVAPALLAAPVARLAAAAVGAKAWLHVQDFEAEAAFATGLLRDGALRRVALWFERAVLRSFHVVSSISPNMCARLIEKGVDDSDVVEFRNWADTDAVRPSEAPSPYRAEWNIRTPHVALYSGNIANKQGIEVVVEAARRLTHRSDLTFVICGEGPYRQHLIAAAEGLSNIQFRDLQPAARLNELMALASVHLLPQRAGAADLVLPSKLTNMLASGRPLVATAAVGTSLAREAEGCGILPPPGDAAAFADAIERLLDDRELHRTTSRAARQRAEDRWSSRTILSGMEARLMHLARRKHRPAIEEQR